MANEQTVVARLEELRREYNILAEYLATQATDQSLQQGISTQSEENEKQLKLIALEQEVKDLSDQVRRLTAEKGVLERTHQETSNENTKTIGRLKQEIKDCMNDTEILKDVVKRLNEQLNRYHLKYGPLKEDRYEDVSGDISRPSIYKLGALLAAYDEVVNERDTALKLNAEKFEKFMVKVDSITSENEKLHARLERLQKEVPFGSEEAEIVASDARLLLEEREILLQELQNMRQQNQQEISELNAEASKLQNQLEDSEGRNLALSSEITSLKTELEILEKKCLGLQEQLKGTVTRQEHQLAVDECQRLFEELRTAYTQESGDLKGRVRAAKHEKKNLAEKLTDSSTHVHNLSVQVSGLKSSLRKYESKVRRRDLSLQAVSASYRVAQSRLRSLSEVCSELLDDREKLLESLSSQRKETEELSREVTLRSATIGALSQKIKEERISWSSRLAESEGGRQAAKSAWKRASKEVKHLRNLISSKDDTIASLIADYRLLGLDAGEAKHQKLRQYLSKANLNDPV
ncbi:centrosomal protein of 89 kDa-like [Macrobrachium rosenbergii]|uniref:centrosomal protein of 89 kDa-like n=1 Tax=Macrobrachium rosenbergii TaxID=79674 RepID=UPI0034D72AB5